MTPDSFDWNKIHQRLDSFRRIVENGGALGSEQNRIVLRARAKALASVPAPEEAGLKRLEVLKFQLAAENYGVELRFVGETHPMKAFTLIPCTPSYIFGLVNVHGRLLTVVDIKKLFGLPAAGLTDQNKVVELRRDGAAFGLLADAIQGVGLVRESDIQPTLPTFTGIQTEYFRGVTKEGLIILDAEKLLTSKNLIVHEEADK